jgi:hypothetical protein
LADAFDADNYTPAPTADLAGTVHVLCFEDGLTVEFRFISEARLTWRVTHAGGRKEGRDEGGARYFALKPRDGVYFVDYLAREEPPAAVSLVLDLEQGIATSLFARLPQSADVGESLAARAARGDELTAVSAEFSSAAIDAEFSPGTPRRLPTSDLVGRRVEYTYSATERYEHIYLNEHFYTWHCLLGSEKGLADTDRCHYLKLGDDLYLFVWREKIIPTLGAVVVDFKAMRTMGKIFGHAQGGTGSTVAGVANFPVGARARLLNVTLGHPDIAP